MRNKNLILMLIMILVATLAVGCGGRQQAPAPEPETPAVVELPEDPREFTEEDAIALFRMSADITEFHYEMTITSAKVVGRSEVWQKGDRQRITTIVEGIDNTIIVDGAFTYVILDELKEIIIMPANEDFESVVDNSATPTGQVNPESENISYLGTEEIFGLITHVMLIEDEDVVVKAWLHPEYGIPMKTETETDQGLLTLEITRLNVGNVDDDVFELPTGYETVDLSESAVHMGQ